MEKSTNGNRRGHGAARVYSQLREDILRLTLAPGEALDETTISKTFGLSRSPVREAMVRLASEGLVKTLPNKNTIVSPLNIAEFATYADALDLVQRITTRLAARLRTSSQLDEIKARQAAFRHTMEKRDALAMIASNRDFHVAVSDASQNRYLSDFNSRLLDEGRRFLRLYYQSFDDVLPEEFGHEHDEIIAAIENRDEGWAEQLAHRHAEQVRARFLEHLLRTEVNGLSVLPPQPNAEDRDARPHSTDAAIEPGLD